MTSFPKTKVDVACLFFLRAVEAAQTDAFRALMVQDFDGIAVEDGDDRAGEVGKRQSRKRK
jgi:hypothetical protein